MRSIAQIQEDFLNDLNQWQGFVQQYEHGDLQKQPGPDLWSIGQVIDHFIIETDWYFSQARKALADTQHLQKSKSTIVAEWFEANSFPDKRFKGPEDLEAPKQPKSKNGLLNNIERLKKEVRVLAQVLSRNPSKGKAEHPGHQFLTAHEWLQYAEMHCRHHFRQKKRIDTTIKKAKK